MDTRGPAWEPRTTGLNGEASFSSHCWGKAAGMNRPVISSGIAYRLPNVELNTLYFPKPLDLYADELAAHSTVNLDACLRIYVLECLWVQPGQHRRTSIAKPSLPGTIGAPTGEYSRTGSRSTSISLGCEQKFCHTSGGPQTGMYTWCMSEQPTARGYSEVAKSVAKFKRPEVYHYARQRS